MEAHRHNVNVLLRNSTFLTFAVLVVWCRPCAVHDVITRANFCENQLRGFGTARGGILAISIDWLRHLCNTLELPCECVISAADWMLFLSNNWTYDFSNPCLNTAKSQYYDSTHYAAHSLRRRFNTRYLWIRLGASCERWWMNIRVELDWIESLSWWIGLDLVSKNGPTPYTGVPWAPKLPLNKLN